MMDAKNAPCSKTDYTKHSHKQLLALTEQKRYRIDRCLYLRVSTYVDANGSAQYSRRWVFRWRDRATGKLREYGLGAFPDVMKSEAKSDAADLRKAVRAGRNPIDERRNNRIERRAKAAKMLTFDQCAERFIDTMIEPKSKSTKHVSQWRNTIRDYASPVFGDLAVNQVHDDHVLTVLQDIWYTKTETASRVQQRLAKILDWATARKLRSGPNPARWRGHLDAQLPRPSDIKEVKHQPALPYSRLYEFMQELREHDGVAARCLEFTILSATRTKESTGAKWSEIDWEARTWTVPSERLKVKIDPQTKKPKIHRVPLSDAAIAVLQAQQGQDKTFIFPGANGGYLSDMAMLMLLRDMGEHQDEDGRDIVTHGFRGTFRTWAAETTSFPHDICEAALAHSIKNKVEAAYQHSDLLVKRAALMSQWATYCSKKPAKATVIDLAAKAKK